MMFDYETLKLVWWLLLGILFIGFGVTGGFDLGVGAMLRVIGRSDDDRKVMINCIGPTWDGNQVWLILGAGAIFAAWPLVYASAFSVLYPAMLAALFALFFRPTGFEYRAKIADTRWRAFWDWGLVVGGAVPTVVFGIAFGLVLQGIPFHYDADMRIIMDGGLLDTLTPFALFAGLVSLVMLCMHGAAFINMKSRDHVQMQARRWMRLLALVLIVLFALGGIWIANGVEGYVLESTGDINLALTPLNQHVFRAAGAWLNNFNTMPWMWIAPASGFTGAALAAMLGAAPRLALVASGFSVAGVILTAGFAAFPFILPSSSLPGQSLTVWNASASEYSLSLMLIAAIIFIPLILAYTSWVYHVLRGPVRSENVNNNEYGTY